MAEVIIREGNGLLPAIVAGLFALAVGIVSGLISYFASKRKAEADLTARLTEVRERGAQDIRVAERQYQLDALRNFHASAGPPRSRTIEAVHGLSDRLRRLLSGEHPSEWTNRRGYYRRSLVWLIVQPFVWIRILDRRFVHLDDWTLGQYVKDDLRFRTYCRLLEDAICDVKLFHGTGYDDSAATAHLFRGLLHSTAEQLIVEQGSVEVCDDSHRYVSDTRGTRFKKLRTVEELVIRLGSKSHMSQFRMARLTALYAGCNALLDEFSLPFREWESAEKSLARLEQLEDWIRPPVQQYLEALLARRPDAPRSNDSGGGENGT